MPRLSLSLDLEHSTTLIADHIAEAVQNRAESQDKTIASVVADALEAALPLGEPKLKFGDDSFTMVLNFSTGQTLAFPLKLRDRDFVGSEVMLKGAELEGARLIVTSDHDAAARCRVEGHRVEPIVRTDPDARALRLNCRTCGDKVMLSLRFGTDPDAMMAMEAAVSILHGDPKTALDKLAMVDLLRRRLAMRQKELTEAQAKLERATAVLAHEMMKLAPQC